MTEDDHTGNTGGPLQSTAVARPPLQTPRNRGWISMRQFAVLMDKTYFTILRWKREGRFHFVEIGGQTRIYEEEVRHILDYGTRPPKQETEAET